MDTATSYKSIVWGNITREMMIVIVQYSYEKNP